MKTSMPKGTRRPGSSLCVDSVCSQPLSSLPEDHPFHSCCHLSPSQRKPQSVSGPKDSESLVRFRLPSVEKVLIFEKKNKKKELEKRREGKKETGVGQDGHAHTYRHRSLINARKDLCIRNKAYIVNQNEPVQIEQACALLITSEA